MTNEPNERDNPTPDIETWNIATDIVKTFEKAGCNTDRYPLNERIAVALTAYANKKVAELVAPAQGDVEAANRVEAWLSQMLSDCVVWGDVWEKMSGELWQAIRSRVLIHSTPRIADALSAARLAERSRVEELEAAARRFLTWAETPTGFKRKGSNKVDLLVIESVEEFKEARDTLRALLPEADAKPEEVGSDGEINE